MALLKTPIIQVFHKIVKNLLAADPTQTTNVIMLSFILDEPRWQVEQNTVAFYDGISNKSMLWNWQVFIRKVANWQEKIQKV